MRFFLLAALALGAGQLGGLDAPVAKPKQFVVYAAEQQEVAAGKRAVLELRFQVREKFHVNSHTPRSDLQIPTKVELEPASGVKIDALEYPPGQSFSFSFDPGEELDVYSGDFVVKVPVLAAAGAHELKGALKYQACDTAACYPPKTLPLNVIFTAK